MEQINKENWKEADLNVDSLWIINERDKSGKHANVYHSPQLFLFFLRFNLLIFVIYYHFFLRKIVHILPFLAQKVNNYLL